MAPPTSEDPATPGSVFKLTPYNGGWTESVLYNFSGGDDGNGAGIRADHGSGREPVWHDCRWGQPWQWSGVRAKSHAIWMAANRSPLVSPDGRQPSLCRTDHGSGGQSLWRCLRRGSGQTGGVVFELSPANGGWTFQVLYDFAGAGGPVGTLAMDASGNLYGAAYADGPNQAGMVFKLTNSNGVWSLTDLHDFDFGTAYFPYGGVTLDASGNLYGTAQNGGVYGWGVVWEITP